MFNDQYKDGSTTGYEEGFSDGKKHYQEMISNCLDDLQKFQESGDEFYIKEWINYWSQELKK